MNVSVLSLAILAFLVGFLLEIAVISMSIHWSIDPFIVYSHAVPLQAAFGLLLPFTVGSLIFFALLIIWSQTRIYFISLLVLLLLVTGVSIGLTSDTSLRSWVDRWDGQWSNASHSMAFQYEKSCCGWENYLDRSIPDCPFLSVSGCRKVVETWIFSKYQELFRTFCFIAALQLSSIATVAWAVFKDRIECVWGELEIPFFSASLYRG
jgi:hypothetical protein